MKRTASLLLLVFLSLPLALATHPTAAKSEEVEILRDEYGVPNIFAPTLEGAAFAAGYAQAEDRLEELLINYRKAEGTMAEAFGEKHFQDDYRQRLFRHAAISREHYQQISPKMRASIEAYQEGIRQFMKEHPEQVPKWAPDLHPAQVVALGRFIIFGWPVGEAGGDLRRGGIEPDPAAYRGSNQWLLAPNKTAVNAPIALIDPHLSWYGEFRFYEMRMYAGDYAFSGVSILGVPFGSLGHSKWASIAMTTGGPDTSDIYEEELNPNNPRQYKYDGRWRELTVRREKIGVREGDRVNVKEVELEYSHHGPIVAHKNGKAYAMAIPYLDEVGLFDQAYEMATAKNLDQMKKALARLQYMAQNIMVGTVQGDIFYVRNGRVPVRAKGVDPSKPIPGNTSATEWQGIHPFSDLVQVTNPPQGYMHNCNVTPFAMMKDSPLTPEKYAALPYLYNASRTNPRHQRAEMMTDLLDAANKVTVEQAIDLAFSPQVYHAELWQARLKAAWEKDGAGTKGEEAAAVYQMIQRWNRRSDADSTGAMAYYAFKMSFADNPMRRAVDPPASLTDGQMTEAVAKAAKWLKDEFGTLQVPYGQYFRVGRTGGQTYPVGGGTVAEAGMATPRAVGFSKAGKELVGHSGQTSTQVVILSKTPRSYTILPLGESDHKDSGHWDDQAEKLFSKGRMKSTYFLDKAELMKHVTAKKVLSRQVAAR